MPMKFFQKLTATIIATGLVLTFAAHFTQPIPHANAANTLLPELYDAWENGNNPCDPTNSNWDSFWGVMFNDQEILRSYVETSGDNKAAMNGVLACALKSGNIRFWMVPYFILNMVEFAVSIAALLSILMIIVGGYFYMYGGLVDDKEKGKTILKYAIGGLVLTTLSWVIADVILATLTS